MKASRTGGGWAALLYTLRVARRVGLRQLWNALRTKNACKTCALGMGGQLGGMRNEAGRWPEVCKKSLQAMVADMQQGLRPEFFQRFSIAELRSLPSMELEACGRLTVPLIAEPGATHYRAVSWEEALGRVALRLTDSPPERLFFYASGRSSNEAGFLLQLFARLRGTNFVNNCSYYCHQASGVGLTRTLGSGTATVALEDVDRADLFVLIGGNPASNHPRLMRSLMAIRRRGGQVIVVNPAREVGLVNFSVPSDWRSLLFGSKIASLYVQPHIGGDIALLTGVAKLLLDRGAIDTAFIDSATEGFDAFANHLCAAGWNGLEEGAGVDRAVMAQFADLLARAKNVVFGWTMGVTHHEHGVANVQSIVNLALLRGMVGRPGAGLLPIRGHSNVQGMGTVGVAPNLRQAVFDNLEAHLGVALPRSPGLDTMACMEAAGRGEMAAALCLGGNLYGSNPDAAFAAQAIGRLEQITYFSTSLNTGHVCGRANETIILPVLARDEEPQPTTQESMFNFVRLSDGGMRRHASPRSEIELLAELGERVLKPVPGVSWARLRHARNVRQIIAVVVPGLADLRDIDETKREFHIPGRVLHQPRFATPSGKARFTVNPPPRIRRGEDELLLMTVRSEGQFNTVVYEEEDAYRGQDRRDVILLSAADIARLRLRIDQRVSVSSSTGTMRQIRVREFAIRPGNAMMYYPEANVLVPRTTDPDSKTPAFKSVVVRLKAE
jgi:molybdopterin-dependent oxidoreductase alpha subunit